MENKLEEVAMLRSVSNSWELVKASAGVLREDKELLIFPILSGIGVILITAGFIVPFIVGGMFDTMFSEELQIGSILIGFLYYVVQYTVIFFANTALVGAATIRLKGGDPTVRDGIQIATKNFLNILGYALIAATVGIILKQLSERSKGGSKFLVNLLGMGWNILTFLVVPVLAVEGVGPIEAIKRSGEMLKRTWGEQITGSFGLGAVSGLAFVVVLVVGGGLAALIFYLELSMTLFFVVAAFVVLALVLLGLVSSTLDGIYTAAVYQYAKTGEVGGFFEDKLVKEAFRLKG
jgi:hypothetical protein